MLVLLPSPIPSWFGRHLLPSSCISLSLPSCVAVPSSFLSSDEKPSLFPNLDSFDSISSFSQQFRLDVTWDTWLHLPLPAVEAQFGFLLQLSDSEFLLGLFIHNGFFFWSSCLKFFYWLFFNKSNFIPN